MTLAAASALALSVVAAPAALAQDDNPTPGYEVTTTNVTVNDKCGTATITWTNPTEWKFFGDYRIGNEEGVADDATALGEIPEGPLKGEEFGKVYHKTPVPAGSVDVEGDATNAVQVPIKVADGTEPVTVSAWIKRGPEQRAFSMDSVLVTPCEPADTGNDDNTGGEDNTTPDEDDEQSTGNGDDKSKTDGDDTKTGGDDTTSQDDDDDQDEADEDGTAPTPEPQEAHIAVTG